MSFSAVKEYQPSEWRKLLDRVFLTDEWICPMNQDVFLKQLILVFYPLSVDKNEAPAEQCCSTLVVTGYELARNKLKKPSDLMTSEKLEQAKLALKDFIGESLGLNSGTLRKAKQIADKNAFKWPYQNNDFGDSVYCVNCNSITEYLWQNRQGNWTVKCTLCK